MLDNLILTNDELSLVLYTLRYGPRPDPDEGEQHMLEVAWKKITDSRAAILNLKESAARAGGRVPL